MLCFFSLYILVSIGSLKYKMPGDKMNNKYSCGWLSNDDNMQLWQFIVKKKIIHECVETLNFSST